MSQAGYGPDLNWTNFELNWTAHAYDVAMQNVKSINSCANPMRPIDDAAAITIIFCKDLVDPRVNVCMLWGDGVKQNSPVICITVHKTFHDVISPRYYKAENMKKTCSTFKCKGGKCSVVRSADDAIPKTSDECLIASNFVHNHWTTRFW